MVWRAAEFCGTWVCGTGDVKLVVGKELQTLRSSCQAFPVVIYSSEASGETIHFFLVWLLIPFTSCFYVLAESKAVE